MRSGSSGLALRGRERSGELRRRALQAAPEGAAAGELRLRLLLLGRHALVHQPHLAREFGLQRREGGVGVGAQAHQPVVGADAPRTAATAATIQGTKDDVCMDLRHQRKTGATP